MNSFLSACIFLCVATQLTTALQCKEQAECDVTTECCSGVPPFGGICRLLAAEGEKCSVESRTAPMFGDFTIGPCTCTDGLVCVQQPGKQKNKGICQLPPTVPAEEPAADDTPAEEPAVDDTPAEEPAADDTPAEEPAVDDTPADEPAADDTPAEEPAADDTPAEEPAADDTPADEPAAEAGNDSAASDSAADAE